MHHLFNLKTIKGNQTVLYLTGNDADDFQNSSFEIKSSFQLFHSSLCLFQVSQLDLEVVIGLQI